MSTKKLALDSFDGLEEYQDDIDSLQERFSDYNKVKEELDLILEHFEGSDSSEEVTEEEIDNLCTTFENLSDIHRSLKRLLPEINNLIYEIDALDEDYVSRTLYNELSDLVTNIKVVKQNMETLDVKGDK